MCGTPLDKGVGGQLRDDVQPEMLRCVLVWCVQDMEIYRQTAAGRGARICQTASLKMQSTARPALTFSTTFVDCSLQALLDALDRKGLGRLSCISTENEGWVAAYLIVEHKSGRTMRPADVRAGLRAGMLRNYVTIPRARIVLPATTYALTEANGGQLEIADGVTLVGQEGVVLSGEAITSRWSRNTITKPEVASKFVSFESRRHDQRKQGLRRGRTGTKHYLGGKGQERAAAHRLSEQHNLRQGHGDRIWRLGHGQRYYLHLASSHALKN